MELCGVPALIPSRSQGAPGIRGAKGSKGDKGSIGLKGEAAEVDYSIIRQELTQEISEGETVYFQKS